MSKAIKRLLAVMCVAILSALAMGSYALAGGDELEEHGTVVISYTEIPLYIENEYIGSGMKLEDVTYVPLIAFCEAMLTDDFDDYNVSWDQELGQVEIETEEVFISLKVGDNYMTANGRYLYLPDSVYNVNGTIIVPIRELVKIFGIEIEWDDDTWTIDIDNSEITFIEDASKFYNDEDVDLLSRLIFSESGNQPLEGMIGVGNVVLNRVASPSFANTIEDVIYQEGQFSVVDSGAINLPASELSVIAAKLCFEGYNTVEDSLYFHNPSVSTTKWFENNRTFCATIDAHEFYS